jgi:hypothetical protein
MGAAKMDLDPMVSDYMKQAVDYKEPSVGRRLAKIFADPIKPLFFQRLYEGAERRFKQESP